MKRQQALALTPGEPAGIGPDLTILYAQQTQSTDCELVAFADPQLLADRAKALGVPLTLNIIDTGSPISPSAPNTLNVVPVPMATPAAPGVLNADNAEYALNCLDQAIHACQTGFCDAMITGPLQKSIINEAGIPFTGHTEYLAEKTQTSQVVMMLATEGLKVALATTHLPLKDVAGAIQKASLVETITILHHDLQKKFGLPQPRILVCGLNPHAGENGHLGTEEIETIIPALETLAQQNIHCIGPLPADTLFTSKHLQHADAVLAMYHDQGLPVLKYKGFGQAANITLGLPIIRTSVDHGTALDLAGTGHIDTSSLKTAIDYARHMANHAM